MIYNLHHTVVFTHIFVFVHTHYTNTLPQKTKDTWKQIETQTRKMGYIKPVLTELPLHPLTRCVKY